MYGNTMKVCFLKKGKQAVFKVKINEEITLYYICYHGIKEFEIHLFIS